MKNLFALFGLLALCQAFAQNGKISGKITDAATNEALIGAVVQIKSANITVATDVDGFYSISAPAGSYTIHISYLGYQSKEINQVQIVAGKTIILSAVLNESSNELQEIVIKGNIDEVAQENVESMVTLQKKTISNVSTISADVIKKLPDRSAGDAVKRVSGASVQEGKYVIIRGLNERYNMALLNGLPLSSTETDKKAFSFDLVPANMLDNLVIYKTGTPDLPGDFAGGIVQITTKDIPEENITSISFGATHNNLTTFKKFETQQGSKTDWLGYDKSVRVIPSGIPSNIDEAEKLTTAQTAENTKKWSHNFGVNTVNQMRPSLSTQINFSRRINLFKKPFGVLMAVAYNNSPSYQSINTVQLRYLTSSYKYYDLGKYRENQINRVQTLASGLVNLSYKPWSKTKITSKNFFNISSDQFVANTKTYNREDPSDSVSLNNKSIEKSLYFASNQLYNTNLTVDQTLPFDIKIKAAAAYTYIRRDVPDYKKYVYTASKLEDENGNYYNTSFQFFANTNANFAQNTGRFFQKLNEDGKVGMADITIPVQKIWKKINAELKSGVLIQERSREVDIRTFAYDVLLNAGATPIDQILVDKNFRPGGIVMREKETNFYNSGSSLFAYYYMLNYQPIEWLKFVGGIRNENYIQRLQAYSIIKIDKKDITKSVLPSITIISSFSKNDNIKASYFKSVSRPEFREIAPVQFFDYINNIIFEGNPALKITEIKNYDLKWEHFFKAGEFLSINLFYKEFKNPTELFVVQAEVPFIKYQSTDKAKVYGVEFEGRYKINKNFILAGNYTLIKSSIKVKRVNISERQLQGQSPYVINSSLNYENHKYKFNSSITINRFGDRLAFDGQFYESLVFEKGRTVLDFQVTKMFLKERLVVRYIVGDLLRRPLILYNDINRNGKFDEGSDIEFSKAIMPRTQNFSISYKF